MVALLSIVAAEATAAIALTFARTFRPSRFAVSRGYFAERSGANGDTRLRERLAEPGFDALLGWQPVPGSMRTFTGPTGATWTAHYDADGARHDEPNPAGGSAARVAAFGDSFTHGDEVEDDETWEHALALLLDTPVRNFGVGAYGTDQALLRLERHLDAGLDVASSSWASTRRTSIASSIDTGILPDRRSADARVQAALRPGRRCTAAGQQSA